MSAARECWVVLGASSAIARAFARQVARGGADVLLAGRDGEDLAASAADLALRHGVHARWIVFDALDGATHEALLARARDFAGAATLNLFLAYGIMPSQAEIDADPALAERVIAANYTSAVTLLQRAAVLFEERKAGHVVALGSVAGDRGRIKNHVYGSAKAGLATYLQGLRARLFRAGVGVTTIKPGFVDTAMTFGLPGMFLVASPDDAAAAMLKAVRKGKDVAYVPFFWWMIMTILRHIPERIFKRLSV
jgi:short-subunit dehydrogenase